MEMSQEAIPDVKNTKVKSAELFWRERKDLGRTKQMKLAKEER